MIDPYEQPLQRSPLPLKALAHLQSCTNSELGEHHGERKGRRVTPQLVLHGGDEGPKVCHVQSFWHRTPHTLCWENCLLTIERKKLNLAALFYSLLPCLGPPGEAEGLTSEIQHSFEKFSEPPRHGASHTPPTTGSVDIIRPSGNWKNKICLGIYCHKLTSSPPPPPHLLLRPTRSR